MVDRTLESSDPGSYYLTLNFTSAIEIYALYKFDRNIRYIFLKRILEIENNIDLLLLMFSLKNMGMTIT